MLDSPLGDSCFPSFPAVGGGGPAVDAGEGAFGRDAERDVVLDRFLERAARLAGECLAAGVA
jgi:hypothetical protein